MKTAIFLAGVVLIFCFAGCAPTAVTNGILSNNTTIDSGVSAVVSVLTTHGYTMSKVDKAAGIVVTVWREDTSANPAGTETRYSADVDLKTITLSVFARKPIQGKMVPTDSREISETILKEIAALVQGEVLQSPSKQRLKNKVIGDDPGDGA